jgi:DNA repair and recombination protein RAD52
VNDNQIKALQANLDPKHVKKPTGQFGPKGDYLEGWHVINELNRIFGFDGWSYTIDLSRDDLREAKDSKGNPQWQAAYTCICTLKVGDAVRQDVGFGSGFAKSIGDAIEGATKEAATDALKRCARTFGNVFGLALYDKSRANVCAPEPEYITDVQRDEIAAMLDGLGVSDVLFCQKAKIKSIKEIPADKFESSKAWIFKQSEQQKEAA